MKCSSHNCNQIAITFHGVTTTTHGYCARHRCCAECGLTIAECKCKNGHTERKEFIEYLMRLANKNDILYDHGIDIPKFGKYTHEV